jgi:RHS repeat-associated protein
VATVPAGNASMGWLYGPEHQRIRETFSKTELINGANQTTARTLHILHPDNEGSLYFEREIKTQGPGAGTAQAAENRHYLSAEKGSFLLITSNGGIQTQAQSNSTLSTPTAITSEQRYWHKDHLGSIVASTNANLTVIERMAYDPFGKRRFTNGVYDQAGTIDAQTTNRGFTGHEHLDELDFIHMNARVYDPDIGRFLSPDPTIPYINNPQAFNRFAYAVNNPLNYIDKDGFKFSDGPTQQSDPAARTGNIASDTSTPNEGNALGKAEALSATGSTPAQQPGSPSAPGVKPGDEVVAENSKSKSKYSTPAPARPSQQPEIETLAPQPGKRGFFSFPGFFTRPVAPAKVSPAPAPTPVPATQQTQQQPATTNQVRANPTGSLPDSAVVVRGGSNTAEHFSTASGAKKGPDGKLSGVSVNSAAGKTAEELSVTVPHGKIGVTTVGEIRAKGGDVTPSPNDKNQDHCSMCGLTPQQGESLFSPTISNPNRRK